MSQYFYVSVFQKNGSITKINAWKEEDLNLLQEEILEYLGADEEQEDDEDYYDNLEILVKDAIERMKNGTGEPVCFFEGYTRTATVERKNRSILEQ
jgi:predicted hydrocarbon binding protein